MPHTTDTFNKLAHGIPNTTKDSLRSASDGSKMGQEEWANKKAIGFTAPIAGSSGSNKAFNPYDPARMLNTLRVAGGGNTTARRTVLGSARGETDTHPPKKRPRFTAPDPEFSKGKTSKWYPPGEGLPTSLRSERPRSTSVIDITGDDEAESSTSALRKRRSSPDLGGFGRIEDTSSRSTVSSPLSEMHDFEADVGQPPSASRARDGVSTIRLQDRLREKQRETAEDSDPIESWLASDDIGARPSISGDKPKTMPGHVKEMVQAYESKTSPSVEMRRVDFDEIIKKSVKNGMKPRLLKMEKVSNSDPLSERTLYKRTSFERYSTRAKKASKNGNARSVALRIEAFVIGSSVHREALWLTCVEGECKLEVRQTAEGGKARWVVNLATDVDSCEYSRMSPDHFPQVLQFELSRESKLPHVLRIDKQNEPNVLIFSFERRHANLESGDLEELINLMPVSLHKEILDGPGSKACWESATEAKSQGFTYNKETRNSKVADLERKRDPELRSTKRSQYATSHTANSEPSASRSHSKPRSDVAGVVDVVNSPEADSSRITRQSARLAEKERDSSELDELILVYPPNGAGAIHVKTSDVKRLGPSQYLNDTIIEFGLKLWLSELREARPGLAEDVHVFSSFFYKKLSVGKGKSDEGFQSVRKWTSKIDLFKKKYIIVPINEHFHWYLAIIHNPEYVLQPPDLRELSKPLTRKRAREDDETVEEAASPTAKSVSASTIPSPKATIVPDSEGETENNDMEVEDMLQRTSLSDIAGRGASRPDGGTEVSSETDTIIALDGGTDRESFTVLNSQEEQQEHDVCDVDAEDIEIPEDLAYPDTPMDVDPPSPPQQELQEDASELFEAMPASDMHGIPRASTNVEQEQASVPPSLFYGSASTSFKGKENSPARASAPSPIINLESDEPSQEVESKSVQDIQQVCHIFIMDSMGSKHPGAGARLAAYLQAEAQDKKGLDKSITRSAEVVSALVPSQPNYYDCGLYILHYVQTFMSDPARYVDLILAHHRSKKRRNYSASDRSADWKESEMGDMRAKYLQRIDELSEAWKEERAAREEQKRKETSATPAVSVVADSDSDIEVSEVRKPLKAPAARKSAKGKAEEPATLRLR